MFITYTTIFAYAGVPNRGRDGQPKSFSLGDGERQYMSSQAWRAAMRAQELAPLEDAQRTVRSRVSIARELADLGPAVAEAVASAVSKADTDGAWSAPIVLGRVEIEQISAITRRLLSEATAPGGRQAELLEGAGAPTVPDGFVKDLRREIAKVSPGWRLGLEIALFGRMVTEDSLARADGALSTSMAIATDQLRVAHDHFVARDDLVARGTAHMGTRPLTTGVYVQESVLDFRRLQAHGLDLAFADAADWVLAASAGAPSKMARAGSMPPPGAADLIVTVAPAPVSALEAFWTAEALTPSEAADRAERRIRDVLALYGHDVAPARLTTAGSLRALRTSLRAAVEAEAA